MSFPAAAVFLAVLVHQDAAGNLPESLLPQVAELHLRFENREVRTAGFGFRVRSPSGSLWTVASFAAALEPDGVQVIDFENRIAEFGFGEEPVPAVRVRRATAGQDLWWSDLLLLENVGGVKTEPLEIRLGLLETEEPLTWIHPEIASSEVTLRLLAQERNWLELAASGNVECTSAAGTLLLDQAGRAVAMISSMAPATEKHPATLLAQRVDSLAGLPPPLVGRAERLPHDPRGFDSATLSPAGHLITWSRYLGGLRAGELGSTGELPEYAPLRRATAAGFDASGLFLAVASGSQVDILAVPGLELLQSFDSLPFPPHLLKWSLDGSTVAAASHTTPGVLFCELSSSSADRVETPPTSALAPNRSGGFLHGTLDGELRLLSGASQAPGVLQDFREPIHALLSTSLSGGFAVGHGNWISSHPAPDQPPSWSRSTGSGEARVLLLWEERLWAGTGSLVEEEDGTYAQDAFLRAFHPGTGEELERSHHFDDLPCAVFTRGPQLLSLTESRELWSWQPSNPPELDR